MEETTDMDTEPVFPGRPEWSVDTYLNQTECWLDDKTWTLVPIDSMSTQRRLYAARALARSATAFIMLVEFSRNQKPDLAGVVELIGRNPREWMTSTPLYGALYRDERDNVAVGGPVTQIHFNSPPGS